MLTIYSGSKSTYCDGVSRRNFLKLGALGVGGLTLPELLRAEEAAGVGSSHKSIINIHLSGGPSHQDMFDLKPDAPVEFRGEFNPIATNVSGFDICEHFPKLATMADKFAVIRSLTGMHNDHSNFHTQSGWGRRQTENLGYFPSIGSVVSKLQGPTPSGAPPYIAYNANANGGGPGFLGPVYSSYSPRGGNLRLSGNLTEERLTGRTNLLSSLDRIRRDVDRSGKMKALDSFTQQAVGVVTSGKVADALDLKKEDPRVVERYSRQGQSFLLARRLIEAGTRVVSFNWGSWDLHSNNFTRLKTQLPALDTPMSALLEDLHQRGMDQDVTVVMWGEFGRTPRVNKNSAPGRDHWPALALCFLAGGGMQTGQVIGTSTRNAEKPKDRPVHLQEVFSTLYHNMGIDASVPQVYDNFGRPQFLAEAEYQKPIAELI